MPEVHFSASVREYLETNPHAEELRLLAACVGRGEVPRFAVTDVDDRGLTLCWLEESRRFVWWYYEEDGRLVVFDGIG